MRKKLQKHLTASIAASMDHRDGKDMTWRDVLNHLKGLTDEQLDQEAMLLPPQADLTKPVRLEPVVVLGTVEEMCHVDGEVSTETQSARDFKHHPEQVVMVYDMSPYDEEGNTMFEMTDDGWIGNKTGKLYDFRGKEVKDE